MFGIDYLGGQFDGKINVVSLELIMLAMVSPGVNLSILPLRKVNKV